MASMLARGGLACRVFSHSLTAQGTRKQIAPFLIGARRSVSTLLSDKEGVRYEVDPHHFAHVTLNRGDKFNTFSDTFIARCSEVFCDVGRRQGGLFTISFVGAVMLAQSLPNRGAD